MDMNGIQRPEGATEARERAGDSQVNNLIARLQDKAYKLLQELPEDLIRIVGEKTPETIETLITERDGRLDYIKGQLIRRETELDTPSMRNLTRELYKEDPARALKWFVLEDKSPECEVSLRDLERTYADKWEEVVDFHEDGEAWGETGTRSTGTRRRPKETARRRRVDQTNYHIEKQCVGTWSRWSGECYLEGGPRHYSQAGQTDAENDDTVREIPREYESRKDGLSVQRRRRGRPEGLETDQHDDYSLPNHHGPHCALPSAGKQATPHDQPTTEGLYVNASRGD